MEDMKRAIVVCAAALILSAFGDESYEYEFEPEVAGIPAGEASASGSA